METNEFIRGVRGPATLTSPRFTIKLIRNVMSCPMNVLLEFLAHSSLGSQDAEGLPVVTFTCRRNKCL